MNNLFNQHNHDIYQLVSLRENQYTHLICTFYNVFNEEEIDRIINLTKKIPFHSGTVRNNNLEKNIRSSKVKFIPSTEDFFWIYKKIIPIINKCNCDNYHYILKYILPLQLSLYEGSKDDFYSMHNDTGDLYDLNNFVDIRKLTFSVQLSDPSSYDGGELIIYHNNIEKNEFKISPKEKGSITFFPSSFNHEVTKVKNGDRHSIVGWAIGPNLL